LDNTSLPFLKVARYKSIFALGLVKLVGG